MKVKVVIHCLNRTCHMGQKSGTCIEFKHIYNLMRATHNNKLAYLRLASCMKKQDLILEFKHLLPWWLWRDRREQNLRSKLMISCRIKHSTNVQVSWIHDHPVYKRIVDSNYRCKWVDYNLLLPNDVICFIHHDQIRTLSS